MSPRGPGLLRQIWYKWKTLQLPWRKQFLVGADLAGNTFWEFKDALNSNRFRRIVKYSKATHFADVRISPQWHQWLRHTREAAPSIQEQQYEVSRQEMMKQLAAEADERWKSQPSYLDAPDKQQPAAPVNVDGRSAAPPVPEQMESEGVKRAVGNDEEVADASRGKVQPKTKTKQKEPSPWDGPQRGAPSENWQPDSWTPGVAQRR